MPETTVEHGPADVDVDALQASQFRPAFPPAWAVPVAAGTLYHAAGTRPFGPVATEGPSWFASIGPGRIRIGSRDHARAQRSLERQVSRHAVALDALHGYEARRDARRVAQVLVDAQLLDASQVPEEPTDPTAKPRLRARITQWSAKSRRSMMDRYSTLDFEPFVLQGTPAMVTLTLPAEWQEVAPTGRDFKRLVNAFRERYARAWGARLRGLWKLEFQRRGAPHLHVLMVPPTGEIAGQKWRQWFASTWADLVVSAAAQALPGWWDFAKMRADLVAVHSHRTASADYAEGLRAADPKRIAVYFAGHSLLKDKEYQHVVPELWQAEGDGPGRFWGYWSLDRADQAVPITAEQAIALARTLRRWSRAQRGTRRASVVRIDIRTGTIRKRTVRRRLHAMRGTAGFLLVNDGPAVALMLAAVLRR